MTINWLGENEFGNINKIFHLFLSADQKIKNDECSFRLNKRLYFFTFNLSRMPLDITHHDL